MVLDEGAGGDFPAGCSFVSFLPFHCLRDELEIKLKITLMLYSIFIKSLLGADFSSEGGTNVSGCLPITPSPSNSGNAASPGLHEERVRVQTPSTPQLYSALNLPYNNRLVFNLVKQSGA